MTKHRDAINKTVRLLLGVDSDKSAIGKVFGGKEEVRMLVAIAHERTRTKKHQNRRHTHDVQSHMRILQAVSFSHNTRLICTEGVRAAVALHGRRKTLYQQPDGLSPRRICERRRRKVTDFALSWGHAVNSRHPKSRT